MTLIDVVYTWVDPNESEWKQLKNAVPEKFGYANNAARFNSNLSELKYSLRSLERYFLGSIGKIYIVSNHGAVPRFIDTSRNDVEIIDDRSLLGGESYCSCVFESVLHRIKGLSENFLYFNDDMLLNRPLNMGDLFDDQERPIWYQDTDFFVRLFTRFPVLSRLIDLDGGVTPARHLTYSKLGISSSIPGPIGHCCRIMNKQFLADFENRYAHEITELRKTKFRSADIFCFLDAYCYDLWAQDKLVFSKSKKSLMLVQTDFASAIINALRVFLSNKNEFLCVSDLRQRRKEACGFLAKFLAKKFPDKSRWEW